MSDTEEFEHVKDLWRIKKKVVRDLEKKAAQYGSSAPPHISIELAQTQADVKLLEERMQIIPHSQDVIDAVGGDAVGVRVSYQLKEIREEFLGAIRDLERKQIEGRARLEATASTG